MSTKTGRWGTITVGRISRKKEDPPTHTPEKKIMWPNDLPLFLYTGGDPVETLALGF